jgi:predicted cation transporter
MALDLGVSIGLFIIFLIVLIGPFKIKVIEQNLEVFLFVCGVIALTISGFVVGLEFNGEPIHTGWTLEIVKEGLTAPLKIG